MIGPPNLSFYSASEHPVQGYINSPRLQLDQFNIKVSIGPVPQRRHQRGYVLQVALQFGGMEVPDAKRLRELEAENAKLKKLLAEAHLDIHAGPPSADSRARCAPRTARSSPAVPSLLARKGHGIRHILIEPGRPNENGYIESFDGKFRDECLNDRWFQTLHQARTAISAWRQDYNEVRPHSSIGRIAPAQFAALDENYHFPSPNTCLAYNFCMPPNQRA